MGSCQMKTRGGQLRRFGRGYVVGARSVGRLVVGVLVWASSFISSYTFSVSVASAQSLIPGVDAFASAIAQGSVRRWAGQAVPWPEPAVWPSTPAAIASVRYPLVVHTRPESAALVLHVMSAWQEAYQSLLQDGWGAPPSDGGRGDSVGEDLYLQVGPRQCAAVAGPSVPWALVDSVTTYLSVSLPGDSTGADVERCVFEAHARAVLLSLDPAEDEAWHSALADWLVREHFGDVYDDDLPGRGWLEHGKPDVRDANLLRLLDAHFGASDSFVRDVVHFARQSSRREPQLRASPDIWEAFARVLDLSHLRFFDAMEYVSVERAFEARERDAGACVSIDGVAQKSKSIRLGGSEGLPALGAACVVLEGASLPASLNVWLRGEFGVDWSLVLVRLDAQGREQGRFRVQSTRDGHAFQPIVDLSGTVTLVAVVTNMSSRMPDADVYDENARSVELVFAAATP